MDIINKAMEKVNKDYMKIFEILKKTEIKMPYFYQPDHERFFHEISDCIMYRFSCYLRKEEAK